MKGLLWLALAFSLAGCGGVTLADGSAARQWGDGPYGLVLVHESGADADSWAGPAGAFADDGMTVLAVEDASPGAVVAAIEHLRAAGRERVALLGAGGGGTAAMEVGRERPELVDQLITVSTTGETSDLGVFPKLFVASEGEAAAAELEDMTARAPGDWNALFLAPGSASGQAILEGENGAEALAAIIRRLEERR